MSLTCAKLAAAKQALDEAKSETSTVLPGDGGTTTPTSSVKCGVAASGASWIRPPVKQASSSGADSGGPDNWICEEEREDEPVSKETWCRVESMPRESWLRRRRKHWPDQSKSTVFLDRGCENVEIESRCDWLIHTKLHDERRHHFPGRSRPNAFCYNRHYIQYTNFHAIFRIFAMR